MQAPRAMDASQAVLMWDRGALGAECDRATQVREGVETYLGHPVFGQSGDITVRVVLSRVEEKGKRRVEARVSQEDAQGRTWGERSVSGDENCASLDEQLTLVVALMVDAPEPVVAESPLPAPPPPPAPDPNDDASGEIETAPSLERPAPSPPHGALLGFGAASLGITPDVGFGAGVAGFLKPRGFWGLGVDAAMFAPHRQALDSGSLKASLLVAGVSLCPFQVAEDGAWWAICGTFQVARLHARSRGLLEARRDTQFFALPGLSGRAGRIIAGRWLVAGGLNLSFPVTPDRYVYRDVNGDRQSAFEVGSFVLTASAGLGLIWN